MPARPSGGYPIHVMSDITQILSKIGEGDPRAAEALLPLVYAELRRLAAQKLAGEKPGQTRMALLIGTLRFTATAVAALSC